MGWTDQIGREPTPGEYIAHLTEIFREVRRVLVSDGVCWLNISDSYCGTGSKGRHADPKNPNGRSGQKRSLTMRVAGCKPKDMIGIPWMLAFALRADGWYLRSDVIWVKGNAMPETVQDRPVHCYEHIFLLTKSRRYYYDAQSVMEPPSLPAAFAADGMYGRSTPSPIRADTTLHFPQSWLKPASLRAARKAALFSIRFLEQEQPALPPCV